MHAREVVDALLALDEPWRSRFLEYMANQATGWRWNGRGEPTREEMEDWLREDLELRMKVVKMVRNWTGGRVGR